MPILRVGDASTSFAGIVLIGASAVMVCGQTPPQYRIRMLGLTDAEHTAANGERYSSVWNTGEHFILGDSNLYSGNAYTGRDMWMDIEGKLCLIGLRDAEYTWPNGGRTTNCNYVNILGNAAGSSWRAIPLSAPSLDAWLFNGGATRQIGFTDVEHTRNDGHRYSDAMFINGTGLVAGFSRRFLGGVQIGESAWLSNGSETERVGVVDAEHTRPDGYQFSTVTHLIDSGLAVGWSSRFIAGADGGVSAWVHQQGVTTRIGLADSDHTRADGYRESRVAYSYWHASQSGFVIGYSTRFAGSEAAGQSAWLWHDGMLTRLGYTDEEHSNGQVQRSEAFSVNETGDVLGISDRFEGNLNRGSTAWLYHDGQLTRLGLIDAEHTHPSAFRSSRAQYFDASDRVIGFSQQFSEPPADEGQSAWIWENGATTRIGLIDEDHTRADGLRSSIIDTMSERGDVAGESARYDREPENSLDITLWVRLNGNYHTVGLTDAAHTGRNGVHAGYVYQLGNGGHALGYSARYDSRGRWMGETSFCFDPDSGSTFPLIFSISGNGQGWYTYAGFLVDDGAVMGHYSDFTNEPLVVDRAYWWSAFTGLRDIESLVRGGVARAGFERLGFMAYSSPDGRRVVGVGMPSSSPMYSGQVYVLSAVTPCPGDADDSRDVDIADITIVLENWSASYGFPGGPGDANDDRIVNFADITESLANFGEACAD